MKIASFDDHRVGVVVTDGDLVPLLPAILWADARASAEVVDLAELFLNFVIEYCIFAKTKKFVKLF